VSYYSKCRVNVWYTVSLYCCSLLLPFGCQLTERFLFGKTCPCPSVLSYVPTFDNSHFDYVPVMGKSQIKSNHNFNQMTTVPESIVYVRNVINVHLAWLSMCLQRLEMVLLPKLTVYLNCSKNTNKVIIIPWTKLLKFVISSNHQIKSHKMKSNTNQITCFQIKSFVLKSNHHQWFNHYLNPWQFRLYKVYAAQTNYSIVWLVPPISTMDVWRGIT